MPDRREETPGERRARYLRLAADARANAAKISDTETKEAYLSLAEAWLGLAREVLPDA